MGIFKRKDKKDRKPFHTTKVGGFLMKTTVGSVVLDSVQSIPWVGTFVTKAKAKAEKDMISDGPIIKDRPNLRKVVGVVWFWMAFRTIFPDLAAMVEEYIPNIQQILELLSS